MATTTNTPNLTDAPSYTDRGRGGALVLVHGFPLDRRMWDEQIDVLSKSCRVIAPDLRGFGCSNRAGAFTIESLAEDVHELVEQLGVKPIVLAGLSMGGYVTLAYAKKYPADLRGLVLIDTKAAADTPEAREGREKMIQLVRARGAAAVAEQMMPKMLSEGTRRSRPGVVNALRTLMNECPPATIEHALAAMRDRPDRTGELASIRAATLVIVGDSDVITPPDVAEAMRSQIPHATLQVIRGAGHMSPMEQPEPVNQAIERFVAECGVRNAE